METRKLNYEQMENQKIEKFVRKSFMIKFNLKTGNVGFCRKWKLSFEWSRKLR
jgi:hypothetical protein